MDISFIETNVILFKGGLTILKELKTTQHEKLWAKKNFFSYFSTLIFEFKAGLPGQILKKVTKSDKWGWKDGKRWEKNFSKK
jgi:hypothetical protein